MESVEFLDWRFVPMSLDDQSKLEPFLAAYPQKLTGFTFASLVSWNEVDHYAWKFLEPETLLLSNYDQKDQMRQLLQPIGLFSQACQERLLMAVRKASFPVKISAVSDSFLSQFPDFCSHFKVVPQRGMFNYVYRAKDLATLSGRRYSKKRNLITQALANYQWTVHPLTAESGTYCHRILENISFTGREAAPVGLQEEHVVLQFFMTHFARLKQSGLVICVNEHPVAFSIYEAITSDSVAVYFEKAEREYKGLYQVINRETAKRVLELGYEFINREEDLDREGLRQMKQSYFPVELIPYYSLISY